MTIRALQLITVLAIGSLLTVVGHRHQPPAPPTANLARALAAEAPAAPGDEPGSAAELARLKRQGPGPDFDSVTALAAARQHRARMPVHSTAAPVSSERARGGAEKGWPALATWQPLGPGNIGGRTRTLVIHPDDHEVMYCGGVSGGVWKTTDGGEHWAVENTGFATAVTEALALGSDAAGTPWLFAFTHGRGAWRVALGPELAAPRAPRGRLSP